MDAGDRKTRADQVNHPPHYTFGSIEVADAIEDWDLDWHRGNAVKYIARAGHKLDKLQDLEKAVWFLVRKVNNLRKVKGMATVSVVEETPYGKETEAV